ncbi:hypothetical protein ACI77J_10070 [Pseudomonas sp. O64]|uniref:hypothetical protein n=1 Tax=unclassified Pseudomonas TaxID=196821 RepID=UPI00387B873C
MAEDDEISLEITLNTTEPMEIFYSPRAGKEVSIRKIKAATVDYKISPKIGICVSLCVRPLDGSGLKEKTTFSVKNESLSKIDIDAGGMTTLNHGESMQLTFGPDKSSYYVGLTPPYDDSPH